jgi:hypothetical protein
MEELVENEKIVGLGASFDDFGDDKCCGYA